MKKIIKEITPKRKKVENAPTTKRVAAYARVSTEQDEQLHSLQVQRDYYENYIKSNPDWELVNIYYDEGITGTSLKRRVCLKDIHLDNVRIFGQGVQKFVQLNLYTAL